MTDTEEARADFLSLRDSLASLQIATLAEDGRPEASYAPFVWRDRACYLFLSELARHTRNLARNPTVSLMMIEDEASARNPFARRRIILQGEVREIERDQELYKFVLADFHSRFGEIIDVIEPLQDFHLFQVLPDAGRFIRGFAQAYRLSGDDLDQLIHINPGQ